MQPHEVIKQAINGNAMAVALRMGKSDSYIYKMMAEPESCRYTRFLQEFLAIAAENPPGADRIFEDFKARYELLHEPAAVKPADWLDAVGKVVAETSESIQAAIADRNAKRLEKEIVEAIDALRRLLRMTVARAYKSEASHEQTGSRVASIAGSPRAR